MRGRALAAAAAVTVVAALAGVAVPAAAAPGPSCPRSLAGSTPPAVGQSASARPVVLVHGWTGSPMTVTADGLLQRLGAAISTFTFDYANWSADWASNANISACLADYVRRVSAAYAATGGDGKVILVAHSMGGLAIRYASSSAFAATPITASVAPLVITLDSPFLGSPWGGAALAEVNELWHGLLGNSLPDPFGTDGGVCLAEHDAGAQLPPQCDGLPPWLTPGTALDEIGGDVTLARTLVGVHLYDIDTGGDGIVSAASATGYATSGPGGTAPAGVSVTRQYVGCTVTTAQVGTGVRGPFGALLGDVGVPVDQLSGYQVLRDFSTGHRTARSVAYAATAILAAPCSHVNIAHDGPALDRVAADIAAYLAGSSGT